MKQELQDKLFKKYPKLFGQYNLSIMESCMPFGIECSTGWYTIIDNACGAIQSYINSERQQRTYALRFNRALKYALAGKREYLVNWYNKIYKNLEDVQKRVEEDIARQAFRPIPEKMPQIEFTQVKEKFGALRLYTNYGGGYIDGVISMASRMSQSTCETCGQPGKMRGKRWYYTACDQHTREGDLNPTAEDDEL